MLLQATDLTIQYGTKMILNHASLFIDEKQKIGVVGANGQGKSTLLKIIATQDKAYGKFSKKPQMTVSYLEQTPTFETGKTLEEIFKDKCPKEDIYRFKTMLTKLGIPSADLIATNLSGGQQKRVALALTLINNVDLLILDEPTNHLDMDMILWLEKYLNHYKGAVLMVTHDRYFLERITETIVEVSQGGLYLTHGGYEGYLNYAAQRLDDALAKKRKRDTLLRMEYEWVHKGVEARRTKSKDRLARYEAMLKEEDPLIASSVEITTMMSRLGRKTITFDSVSKSFGDHLLFKDFTYRVQLFDRIGILGDNGAGKTTLLNLLCGKDHDYEGSITIGDTVKIGYFDQLSMNLDPNKKALDFIRDISDAIQTSEGIMTAKTMMSKFLFDDDTMYLPIARLSGGQKRRLYLLSILMAEPNVLIFDEPTNDLDIDTLTVLEDFLDSFKGIVIIVSHDRYFLDKVIDKLFVLKNQQIEIYNGTCSDYLETISDHEEKKIVNEKNDISRKNTPKKLTYMEKKELEALNEEIPILESKLEALNVKFNDTSLTYEQVSDLSNQQQSLEQELEEKTERWMELLEKQENA